MLDWVALHPDAVEPTQGYPGEDAGFDLTVVEDAVVMPGSKVDIKHGIAVELPVGYYATIVHRSSTPRRRNLLVHAGTIDWGYRGELFALVENVGTEPVRVQKGERLVQLIPDKIVHLVARKVDALGPSARGAAGFGSTGGGNWIQGAPVVGQGPLMEPFTFVHRVVPPRTVYLGGPIDYAGDPDMRHRRLAELLPGWKVFCPQCVQIANPISAMDAIKRNLQMIDDAQWAVFVWNDEFSVGTPIEIWEASATDPEHVIIVGHMGPFHTKHGLFRQAWHEAGVVFVPTLPDAAEVINTPEATKDYGRGTQPAGLDARGPSRSDGGEHEAQAGVGEVSQAASFVNVHGVLSSGSWDSTQRPPVEPT